MKRTATAVAILAVLLAASAVSQTLYTWDGANGDKWVFGTDNTDNNWDTAIWPGGATADNTDAARMLNNTAQDNVVVDNTVMYDVSWVLVDADNADTTLKLQITTNGDLDVLNTGNTGYIRLIAGSHLVGPPPVIADDAELEVLAGTLDADILQFYGTTSVNSGHAIGDFDVSMTAGVSSEVEGYVDIEVKGGITFSAGSLSVGVNGTVFGDLSITRPDGTGTGTVSASTLTINGGPTFNSSIEVGPNARLITTG